jgi:hypothetical protein
MEPFRAGRVLSRSFSVWLANFVPFSILALVCNAPVLAYGALAEPVAAPEDSLEPSAMLMNLLGVALQQLVAGATAFGVFQALRGQKASIGQAVGVGLRRLFPVLGVALACGLLVLLGLYLLVVPGIVLLCVLYVAVPVAIIERQGVGRSLTRSAELTRGARLAVFWVFLWITVGMLAVVAVMIQLLGFEAGEFNWPINVAFILFMSFGAVTQTVAYHDLRMAKEGTGIEDLAKVFD